MATNPGIEPVVSVERKPNFAFHHAGLEPECTCLGREPDDNHRQFNFDLCRALDMTKLGIVLERMVTTGWAGKREIELFHSQASTLLALMRTANNRAYASAIAAMQSNGEG